MSTFSPVTLEEFQNVMDGLGFHQTTIHGVEELVWERDVTTKSNVSYPFKVRIYSTIDRFTKSMRECGSDAIRIMLVDKATNKPLKFDKRVNRVGAELMTRVVDRAREVFRYAITPANHCPQCGGMMIVRKGPKGKFRGCSAFPTCKHTDHNVE